MKIHLYIVHFFAEMYSTEIHSVNLVIVWSIFIKGINLISLDISFQYKVCACEMLYAHFCCHSISA